MKKSNISDVPEEEWSSPGGRYQLFRKSLSRAVGGKKDIGEWGGGHPFDLEQARLPPGKSNFPLHHHSAQSELFLIASGHGLLHEEDGATCIGPGDILFFGPGVAHRIENNGQEDLVYYVLADNPRADVCTYPETGKVLIKPERICLQSQPADYFEPGE